MDRFTDGLKEIGPELIDALMRIAKARNQADLAGKTGLEPNQISRYKQKKVFPDRNLFAACKRLGLRRGQALWLVGKVLTDKFASFAFPIGEQAGEVREPASPYGGPSLEMRIEAVVNQNLEGLEPQDRVNLATARKMIKDDAERARAARVETNASLETQLRLFDQLFAAARRRRIEASRSR